MLHREISELKAENMALRLQLDEIRLQLDELRLAAAPPAPSLPSTHPLDPLPPPPPPPPPPSLLQQQQQPSSTAAIPAAANRHPPATKPSSNYVVAESKAKAKKRRQRERAAAAAAATGAATAAAETTTATAASLDTPNLIIYHDSNFKFASPQELKNAIGKINNNNNNNNNKNNDYNFILRPTFTLGQTLNEIKQTNYKNNDKVIINVLTNDARPTKHRRQKTITETRQLQNAITQQLTRFIPRGNITLVEAPPNLNHDIYNYNYSTCDLSLNLGIRFAPTLIGEDHIWRDGLHIMNRHRPLMLKTIAAAAAGVDPHIHFRLSRPPSGLYGPWMAPFGMGMTPNFRDAAVAPIQFRNAFRQRPAGNLRPLNKNIQGPR